MGSDQLPFIERLAARAFVSVERPRQVRGGTQLERGHDESVVLDVGRHRSEGPERQDEAERG